VPYAQSGTNRETEESNRVESVEFVDSKNFDEGRRLGVYHSEEPGLEIIGTALVSTVMSLCNERYTSTGFV
jgi:hypothetical protein